VSDATSGRPIRAVVFDMGGILEPPADEVVVAALAPRLELSPAEFRERRAEHARALTVGRLTLRDFYAGLGAGGRPVDPDALVAHHLAVYGDATARLDAEVLGLIAALRRDRLVACLTNTEIEVARFNHARGRFRLFDRAFLSTELGLAKPDRAIFERVVGELGCRPAEAVFTDDRMDNVAGAEEAGLHAIHYRDFAGFSAALARLLASER